MTSDAHEPLVRKFLKCGIIKDGIAAAFQNVQIRRSTRMIWLGRLQGYNQTWDPPHDNVSVTDSDRGRILNNIREAFRSQGFEIDVI